MTTSHSHPQMFNHTPSDLFIGDRKITSDIQKNLYNHINGSALLQYIRLRENWWNGQDMLVDWAAHETALGSVHPDRRSTYVKLIHGWNYTAQREDYIHGTSNICPLCLETRDDSSHILSCTRTTQARTTHLVVFLTELTTLRTAPAIVSEIRTTLVATLQIEEMQALPLPTTILNADDIIDNLILNATTQQAHIGWNNFLKGRISDLWRTAQQEYYNIFPHRRATRATWASKVVSLALKLLLSIWTNRNDLYNTEQPNQPSIRTTHIHAWVSDFYSARDILDIGAHNTLFDIPIEERLTHRPATLMNWLDTADRLVNVHAPITARQKASLLRPSRIYRFYNRIRLPKRWTAMKTRLSNDNHYLSYPNLGIYRPTTSGHHIRVSSPSSLCYVLLSLCSLSV